jgi:hypothetical protein
MPHSAQVTALINEPPLIHSGGERIYGLDRHLLEYIGELLQPQSRTLETGLGLSTIIFSTVCSEHTAIVPAQDQIDRYRRYCADNDIKLDHVELICGYSQDVLPSLERRNLDLVLIDGGHGYPIPALDWFYTTPMLRTGGYMVIDDTQLSTGDDLLRFLRREPDWRMIRRFCRSAVFERIGAGHAREWSQQPEVVAKSRWLRLRDRLCTAGGLVRDGRWSDLRKRLLKTS